VVIDHLYRINAITTNLIVVWWPSILVLTRLWMIDFKNFHLPTLNILPMLPETSIYFRRYPVLVNTDFLSCHAAKKYDSAMFIYTFSSPKMKYVGKMLKALNVFNWIPSKQMNHINPLSSSALLNDLPLSHEICGSRVTLKTTYLINNKITEISNRHAGRTEQFTSDV